MAENRLSWTELRRALANRAGVTEKEANAFLSAFNAQLIEGLKSDKLVKVNGLGSFKLLAVAPRKSVNVTTGEEITIEGYNKVAFVPEVGIRELVESSKIAKIENSPALDPIQKLGAQAEEIVDILGELGQSPKEPEEEKPAVEEEKPVVEEEKPAEIPAEPIKEKPVVEEEPVVEEKPVEIPAQPKKKRYHFMRDTLICVVILLMLLLVGYFFLRHELSQWMDEMVNGKPETEMVESIQPSEVSVQPEEVSSQQEELEEWTYDEILLTEDIPYGSRLAWISKKYYGDKVYWPYIYEANKDRIANPSKIQVGTPIRVPKLSAAQRDTTDVRFLKIREEAYKRVRN